MAAGANVVRHPYNIGNGAAVKSGMRAAKGKVIVLMDGDGQHKPEDIPKLLAAADHFSHGGWRARQGIEAASTPQPGQHGLQSAWHPM